MMGNLSHTPEETVGRAALYVLGLLDGPERSEFERHLEAGCPSCRAEIEALSKVTEQLAGLSDPADPPVGLRERLLNRVAVESQEVGPASSRDPGGAAQAPTAQSRTAPSPPEQSPAASSPPVQVWKGWTGGDRGRTEGGEGWHLLRADEGAWEPTGAQGVDVRRLFLDPERRTVTMMIRMRPGSTYPAHRHALAEECYVLEGDLHVGEVVMRAGDYQRVETQSVHPVQSTDEGCTLLVVSSLDDEIYS